jgi:hypothetical protein
MERLGGMSSFSLTWNFPNDKELLQSSPNGNQLFNLANFVTVDDFVVFRQHVRQEFSLLSNGSQELLRYVGLSP